MEIALIEFIEDTVITIITIIAAMIIVWGEAIDIQGIHFK